MTKITDPIELIVSTALTRAGVVWEDQHGHKELDFFLPEHGIQIECKQFYSDRISRQLSENKDVIVVQGKKAAMAFSKLLTEGRSNPSPAVKGKDNAD